MRRLRTEVMRTGTCSPKSLMAMRVQKLARSR